jgi:hypothetical protein
VANVVATPRQGTELWISPGIRSDLRDECIAKMTIWELSLEPRIDLVVSRDIVADVIRNAASLFILMFLSPTKA